MQAIPIETEFFHIYVILIVLINRYPYVYSLYVFAQLSDACNINAYFYIVLMCFHSLFIMVLGINGMRNNQHFDSVYSCSFGSLRTCNVTIHFYCFFILYVKCIVNIERLHYKLLHHSYMFSISC